MFTGIVTAQGRIRSISRSAGSAVFDIATGDLDLTGLSVGASVAVNGVCLTVVALAADGFRADLSPETLELTTLGGLAEGAPVNLERALALGEELGGHLVTGHVDGIAAVAKVEPHSDAVLLRVTVPAGLAPFVARKGSVCVDGVSLTVNAVEDDAFEVMIIPHTQEQTIISGYTAGTRVNIEVDIVARYLQRLAQYPSEVK